MITATVRLADLCALSLEGLGGWTSRTTVLEHLTGERPGHYMSISDKDNPPEFFHYWVKHAILWQLT